MVLRKKKKARAKPVRLADTLVLPEVRSVVAGSIDDYSVLIHGVRKIGKTTLVSEQENVLCLTFDPLRPGLAIMQRHVPNWEHAAAWVTRLADEAARGEFPFERVVIDRVDLAYEHATDASNAELEIQHASELEWGAGWKGIRKKFEPWIIKLLSLPCGVWFISHSEWGEVKLRGGTKIDKLRPDMGSRCNAIVSGATDLYAAYDYDGADRVLILEGDDSVEAGHNLQDRFRTADGRKIQEVYMGTSPAQSWANLLAAFENKQTYLNNEERKAQPVQRSKKKTKKKAGARSAAR